MSQIEEKLIGLCSEVEQSSHLSQSFMSHPDAEEKVFFICRHLGNKAPIRFLMSCLAAKIDRPQVDIRKPYTQIGTSDSYSGRTYDEGPVQAVISKYNLPCNSTTAYLTPAFRNRNTTMTPDLNLVGKHPQLYKHMLDVLNLVYKEEIFPETLLKEIYRQLILVRQENNRRISELLAALRTNTNGLPLSSEKIIVLLQQHLSVDNASRLPTLIVAAAYKAIGEKIGEQILSLNSHNAADSQTGALGDVEVTLLGENNVVTCYEMKDKRVTKTDLDIAIQKISRSAAKTDNYIFVTTETIDPLVEEYARSLYEQIGVEFAVLDCLGFVRHLLHFFHRSRVNFLNAYQELVLSQPNSSVGQPLKEAFLALRAAAEAG